MASDQRRVRVSLSGKPLVGKHCRAGQELSPSAGHLPLLGPLGSTRGIEELRGSRDLVSKDAMFCWFQCPRSKGRGTTALYVDLLAWLRVCIDILRDFLAGYHCSQYEIRIRTNKAKGIFSHEVAGFILVLLGTHL